MSYYHTPAKDYLYSSGNYSPYASTLAHSSYPYGSTVNR